MPFPFIALAISIGFTILGQLLSPKPKQKATTLAEFDVPTATEDRPKPYWVGTVRHKSPNCVWYGDYTTKAIKVGGILTFGMKTITGYKYFLGFDLNLGWGQMDELIRIRMADKEAWTGSASTGDITIDKPKLFGGENEGSNNGGFQGKITIYNGNGTQTADAYLVAKSGATPAYKNDVHLVFKGITSGGAYVGNSASLPEMTFDVRRCPNQLAVTANKHIIDTYDANPVCALFEFMTRPANQFGGGFSSSQFDLTNWRTAAATLHTEGLGISRMFDSAQDVDAVIEDYLNLIDGVINVNKATGLLELKLARADYDPDTIPVLTDDDILEVVSFKRGAWIETYNEAKLTYVDRTQEFETLPCAAQDVANASGQAEVRSQTVDIKGISTAANANKVTFRELRVISTPLAAVTLKVSRAAYQFTGGSVFKWQSDLYGITMIFRVSDADAGTITASSIELRCVQDIFSLGAAAYNDPQATTWTVPSPTAANITVEQIIEQPYFFHQTSNTRVATMAKPANGGQAAYDLWVRESTTTDPTRTVAQAPYTPTGTLNASYTSTAYNTSSQLVVVPDWGMEDLPAAVAPEQIVNGEGLLMIDTEILAYESYTVDGSGNYIFNGVWGGLLDTLLATHSSAARVWFISEGMAIDPSNYTAGATMKAKLSSLGSDGSTIALGSCTELTL